jgi:hypothetical protein
MNLLSDHHRKEAYITPKDKLVWVGRFYRAFVVEMTMFENH